MQDDVLHQWKWSQKVQISRNKGRLTFSFKTLHAKTNKQKLETAWNHRNTSFTKVFHLAKTLLQESDVSIIFCCHITSGKTEKTCDSNTKTRFQLSGLLSNHFSSMMWNVLKPRRQPDFITSYQCQQYVYVNDQCLLQSSSCIKERHMATRNEYE